MGKIAGDVVLSNVRARVISVSKQVNDFQEAEPGKTKSLSTDPFQGLIKEGKIIEPPFDMLTLAMLPEANTELIPCLEALETNIEMFGHRFKPRINEKKGIPDDIKVAVDAEKIALENFFMYCTQEPFIEFRSRLRRDLETTGNNYYEIIRSSNGTIQSFQHMPSYQMRLSPLEDEPFMYERPILELQSDKSVKVVKINQYKRFRRFIQSRSILRKNLEIVEGEHKTVWFKEFGDPRIYNKKTGEIVKNPAELKEEDRANEVIHTKIYSSRTPYGLPRYIGNLLSIFGDRAAEEINFITFKNNNIPSMIVAVSNGMLTEDSIERVTEFVESQIQGSDNYSKFLVLEAEGNEEGEDGGHIKIDVKPLVSEQHKDALFQEYSANNRDKIRRVWRLPPIFVGRSDDYTRSTSESSRRLGDEQIFAPQRDLFDANMNRNIFPEMGFVYHRYKSNSPNTTDNQELVKILSGSEKTGGMTPRIARLLLTDILGMDLPDFVDGFDPDVPFSLTMAEAVKNKAEPAEPGQQITALKFLQAIHEGDGGDVFEVECENCHHIVKTSIDDDENGYLDYLLKMHDAIEKRWAALLDN